MRPRPRLVASASMAARSAFSSSQRSPVRRLVKADAKPVARLTSCSSSVMRAYGSIASIPSAKARASGGADALTGATCRRPSRNSTPSSSPRRSRRAKRLSRPSSSCPSCRQPLIGRRRQAEFRRGRRNGGWRQQVAVETAVVGRALDPDVARAQLVAQRGEDGRLVEAAVWSALRPAPGAATPCGTASARPAAPRACRTGSARRSSPRAASIGSLVARGLELPAPRSGRARTCAVSSSGRRRGSADLRSARSARVCDLAAHAQQLRPAHRLVYGLESIAVALPGPRRAPSIVPWNRRISRPTSPALAT